MYMASFSCPDDDKPICNGTNGVMGEDCCGSLLSQHSSKLPTCDKWTTTACQPVCDETNTVGCTEAAAPNAPRPNRFEGKWTHTKDQSVPQQPE